MQPGAGAFSAIGRLAVTVERHENRLWIMHGRRRRLLPRGRSGGCVKVRGTAGPRCLATTGARACSNRASGLTRQAQRGRMGRCCAPMVLRSLPVHGRPRPIHRSRLAPEAAAVAGAGGQLRAESGNVVIKGRWSVTMTTRRHSSSAVHSSDARRVTIFARARASILEQLRRRIKPLQPPTRP